MRLLMIGLCCLSFLAINAQIIVEQDFDGVNSWTFTENPSSYNINSDVWAIVGSVGPITMTTNFWGMRDLNNSNGGGSFDHTLTFNTIDVSSNGDIELTFDYDVVGYDGPDIIDYILTIDGTPNSAVSLKGTGTASGTITEMIPSSANSVSVQIVARQDGGSDYAGVDNFKLTEVVACPLTITGVVATCDAITTAVDNYTTTISYTGGGTDTYTITPSSGSVGGDDPNTVPAGDIVITGVPEGTDLMVNITSVGGCLIDENITSPTCVPLPDLVINEFCYDPTGLDTNQDGSSNSSSDEFIELYNFGASGIDLNGYSITFDDNVRVNFASGDFIPSGEFFTIFGGGNADNISGNTLIDGLTLTNSGTRSIKLLDNNGTIIDEAIYSSSTGGVDIALARSPDITGAFVDHDQINVGVLFTPGRLNTSVYPSNDDCSNAKSLATNSAGSLINESFEFALIDDTNCSPTTNKPAVWYNVNTDASGGDLIIEVQPATGQDVLIAVFSDCSGTFIDCVDDNGAGFSETITITDPSQAQGGGSSGSRSADLDYKILVADMSIQQTPGTFDIFASGTALPVDLVEFKGRILHDDVNLYWTTLTEVNNDLFIIEHSIDGSSFREIGREQGKGNSTEINQYSFLHEDVNFKSNYYRLKQIDYDGSITYSDVIFISKESSSLSLAFNVVNDKVELLQFNSQNNYTIVNISGVVVDKGALKSTLDVSTLTPGIYYIKSGNTTRKFVKI